MAGEREKLDRDFRLHRESGERRAKRSGVGAGRMRREERDWADAGAAVAAEKPYRPIRRREDRRTGCLGGLMVAAFILSLSVILAILAWMAASDMLALNKESFTATVVLPQNIFSSETVSVTDEDGQPVGTKTVSRADLYYLSNTLKQAGLIEYRWLFEFYCRISHADEKVRPGEYQLLSTYDYRAMIQHMRPSGSGAATVNITFYEGMTMREMFVRLERQGVSSYEALENAAKTYNFRYDFLEGGEDGDEAEASRLEGYLFPETYNFYVNMQASSAINKFLEQFNSVMDELETQLETSDRSLQEIVTVASMIEKEAADDEERAEIASVIYNRLNAGMPLGIDATILYVHQDHEGAPTAAMLEENSPYNTRLRTGLPPTPICNPGLQSLKAALRPAVTDYYYYALDTSNGRHRFFTNLEEFNTFVATQNY